MKLAGKIWLSLSVLLAGYAVSVTVSSLLNRKIAVQSKYVWECQYPVAVIMEGVASDHENLWDVYQVAVLVGDHRSVAQASASHAQIVEDLESVLSYGDVPDAIASDVRQAARQLEVLYKRAASTYSKFVLAGDRPPESLQQEVASLADQHTKTSSRLKALSAQAGECLEKEMRSIEEISAFQSKVNIGVFLLVIVISVPIMSISIRRLVLHPFQQILTAANAGEAPDTSSLASDEIGQLAGAFASLHERQLQTQEHLSDTVESLKKEIAGREAVESELRSSEEHLSATLRSIGDGVIATDSEGKVTSINPSAVDLTGWLSGDAIGRPLDEVFKRIDARTREELPSPIAQIMDSGEILDLGSDAILLSRTGMEHQIADSGAPIRNVEGESVGVVLVFRDVSSQRELEQQLRHAEKMTAIGQLAGGIAHDFNNMLGGISGALQIIRGSVSDDGEDREMVDLALQSASKASDLTAKLSSFARKGKLVSTAVDIHTSIQNAVSLLERSIDRRVSISTDLTAEASTVEGDASQLENALLNLGLNARDAMPDGGEITISTKIADLEESHCRASAFDLRPGPYIQISVRDTGTGMNDATLNRMFEPFFTTKEESKGTGLGLAAVYGAVKDHKGSIQACSKVGHGTVFHICLPLSESAEVIPEQSEEELPHGTGCILVVDDELAIRATSKRFLASLGYEVLLAEDGAEGVEVYRDNQDRITAVVLDMIMPRVDGKECFQELVKLNPEVKVIFSSGFVREDQLGALVGKQIVGFIKKPYRRAEFARLLALAASPA